MRVDHNNLCSDLDHGVDAYHLDDVSVVKALVTAGAGTGHI